MSFVLLIISDFFLRSHLDSCRLLSSIGCQRYIIWVHPAKIYEADLAGWLFQCGLVRDFRWYRNPGVESCCFTVGDHDAHSLSSACPCASLLSLSWKAGIKSPTSEVSFHFILNFFSQLWFSKSQYISDILYCGTYLCSERKNTTKVLMFADFNNGLPVALYCSSCLSCLLSDEGYQASWHWL